MNVTGLWYVGKGFSLSICFDVWACVGVWRTVFSHSGVIGGCLFGVRCSLYMTFVFYFFRFSCPSYAGNRFYNIWCFKIKQQKEQEKNWYIKVARVYTKTIEAKRRGWLPLKQTYQNHFKNLTFLLYNIKDHAKIYLEKYICLWDPKYTK